MKTVLRTTDPVLIGFARTLLADNRIPSEVADRFTSAIEGSIGILPSRLLVPDDLLERARKTLVDAGLAAELAGDDD